MTPSSVLLGSNVTVGEHVQAHIGPFTFNLDTIWATALAGVVVCSIGLAVRWRITSGVPNRLQLAWEIAVETIRDHLDDTVGPRGLWVVPLALTLFLFILICNGIEILSLGSPREWLAAPTGDINLTLALAVFVIVLVHVTWIRTQGFRRYAAHYLWRPFPKAMMPFNVFMNVVEEISKPITLALRLFGNLFAGALMLELIAALGAWGLSGVPVGNVAVLILDTAWKLFDVVLIGPIQAFIFALLTILYFDTAMSSADATEGQS